MKNILKDSNHKYIDRKRTHPVLDESKSSSEKFISKLFCLCECVCYFKHMHTHIRGVYHSLPSISIRIGYHILLAIHISLGFFVFCWHCTIFGLRPVAIVTYLFVVVCLSHSLSLSLKLCVVYVSKYVSYPLVQSPSYHHTHTATMDTENTEITQKKNQ